MRESGDGAGSATPAERADQLIWLASDESAQVALGARIARALEAGVVIYLEGELGVGKTTLCRGLIRALGHCGAVKSPTYTLVEPYELPELSIYHFDLYRLGDPEELEFLGVRDYLTPRSLWLVEWPTRGKGVLPPADLVITIDTAGPARRLQLAPTSCRGMAVTARLGDHPMPGD